MRTWHRGSAGLEPKGLRLTHHAVYRKAGNDWMDFTAWPTSFYTHSVEERRRWGQRCIERLTTRQRQLIGIPAPGHPYWTADTVAGFSARYPGADGEPYRAGQEVDVSAVGAAS